jgi:hypothetical protein
VSSGQLTLSVLTPVPTVCHLGHGITTDPITLQIQLAPQPYLELSAGIKVPVANSPQPLDFTAGFQINEIGAHAFGAMQGYWCNPLGVGKSVKIGPVLDLGIGIIFAQFLATGTPSSFSFSGALQIGQVKATLSLRVSDNPMSKCPLLLTP